MIITELKYRLNIKNASKKIGFANMKDEAFSELVTFFVAQGIVVVA